jgi:hypothetical protein
LFLEAFFWGEGCGFLISGGLVGFSFSITVY